jgi:hypothetical protein
MGQFLRSSKERLGRGKVDWMLPNAVPGMIKREVMTDFIHSV